MFVSWRRNGKSKPKKETDPKDKGSINDLRIADNSVGTESTKETNEEEETSSAIKSGARSTGKKSYATMEGMYGGQALGKTKLEKDPHRRAPQRKGKRGTKKEPAEITMSWSRQGIEKAASTDEGGTTTNSPTSGSGRQHRKQENRREADTAERPQEANASGHHSRPARKRHRTKRTKREKITEPSMTPEEMTLSWSRSSTQQPQTSKTESRRRRSQTRNLTEESQKKSQPNSKGRRREKLDSAKEAGQSSPHAADDSKRQRRRQVKREADATERPQDSKVLVPSSYSRPRRRQSRKSISSGDVEEGILGPKTTSVDPATTSNEKESRSQRDTPLTRRRSHSKRTPRRLPVAGTEDTYTWQREPPPKTTSANPTVASNEKASPSQSKPPLTRRRSHSKRTPKKLPVAGPENTFTWQREPPPKTTSEDPEVASNEKASPPQSKPALTRTRSHSKRTPRKLPVVRTEDTFTWQREPPKRVPSTRPFSPSERVDKQQLGEVTKQLEQTKKVDQGQREAVKSIRGRRYRSTANVPTDTRSASRSRRQTRSNPAPTAAPDGEFDFGWKRERPTRSTPRVRRRPSGKFSRVEPLLP